MLPKAIGDFPYRRFLEYSRNSANIYRVVENTFTSHSSKPFADEQLLLKTRLGYTHKNLRSNSNSNRYSRNAIPQYDGLSITQERFLMTAIFPAKQELYDLISNEFRNLTGLDGERRHMCKTLSLVPTQFAKDFFSGDRTYHDEGHNRALRAIRSLSDGEEAATEGINYW